MNNRIDELATQAGAKIETPHWVYYDDFSYQKFALLIARDIVGMYDAIDNGNKVEGTDDFVEAVTRRYA